MESKQKSSMLKSSLELEKLISLFITSSSERKLHSIALEEPEILIERPQKGKIL